MANVKTVGNKQKTSSLLCKYPLKILIFYQDGMLASTELIHISYYMLNRDCWENASLMINVTFWSLWELTINQVLSRVTTLSCSKLEICSKEHWSRVHLVMGFSGVGIKWYPEIMYTFAIVRPKVNVSRSCKRCKTLFKSLLFWLAWEESLLAVEVLSPCQK